MKDYDYFVLWLDYFNKSLTRRKGRKVKKDSAIFEPSISDLLEAAKAAGYNPSTDETNDHARYPRRPFVRSGYVLVPKKEDKKKSAVINSIGAKLLQRRLKQKGGQR